MNPFFPKIWYVLLRQLWLVAMAIVAFGLAQQAGTPALAQEAVTLAVEPATQTVQPGDIFTVTVEIQAGNQEVDTAAAFLNFDPTILAVQDLSGGSTLPSVVRETYDTSAGTIDYVAGQLGGPFPTGTLALLTIEFEALSSGDAGLTFATQFPRRSDVAKSGASVLDTIIPGTVMVNLAPTADAGADQTITDSDDSGAEAVTLDGTGSTDSDGSIASYVWSMDSQQVATGPNPTVDLSVGMHQLTLTVTDDDGATDTDTVVVTVSPASVTEEVVLAIEPPTTETLAGQQFSVEIEVRAGTQQVDGAAAYLNFDPSLLQVVSITQGDVLDAKLREDFNNSTGEVNVAYGTFTDFPSGTFTLATITFEAIGASAGAELTFNREVPRVSDVTFGGQPVLEATVPGTVIIESVSFIGSVLLEGREPAPNPAWSIPLTVRFYQPGQTTPVYEFTPTTNESGEFTLQGVEPSTYDIAVKNRHTLQNVRTNVTITAGANQVDFGTLREGDANNNNVINLVDFSILVTSFERCMGDSGYDDRADFNKDDCVDLVDFSLLTNHFDEVGDVVNEAQAVQGRD